MSRAARERIGAHLRRTPLEYSPELGVHFKLENQQLTGSFKVRGALSRLLTLTAEERTRGIVAASSGNHGLGVAHGMATFGIPGTVFVPENAAPSKVAAIRRRGAGIQVAGRTCEEAEAAARADGEATDRVFVSPYNDPFVVAGQGTLALELVEQSARPWDAVFASVGCGGLISGIAGTLKALQPGVRIYGCSPRNDCAMATSVARGAITAIDARPTLSDGTAGGVEPGSITFGLCRDLVDEFVLVEETEIASALRWLLEVPHQLVEGAAAVALAAYLEKRDELRGKNVAIVLCGANIGLETLKGVLHGD